jgi:aldose 1-epimerase
MIEQRPFGTLPTGEAIEEFTLKNAQGVIVRIITFGGIITQLHVPDRAGSFADVVLGFNNLQEYAGGHPYFGCITGRIAGRLTRGKFSLDGRDYSLAINNEPNHLHGGNVGLDKRVWSAQTAAGPGGESKLRLSYLSPDGEEGYPGNLAMTVVYALTEANELVIEYEATTDQATPISLTNHSYFNLAGKGSGHIDDHVLQIFSDEYAPADKQMTLSDRREPVAGQANDFTKPKRVGEALPGLWEHHGDNYFLRPVATGLAPAAKVTDPASGRTLFITTTEPCLQFYTGAFLDSKQTGKAGKVYGPHAALCLECQRYPNAINKPEFGNIVLRPGETYRQKTIHAFSAS